MQEETDSKLTNAPPPTSLSCTIKKRNQISDAELIRRCQSGSGHPPPWDDFFRRFLYPIDKRIAKSLLSFGLSLNKDSVDEIRAELVIRLFSKNLLDKLENVTYFKAWIGQVIHNLTIDWVRKTNRSSEEFTRQAEKNTLSLSDSVSPGAETVLEDVLSTECIDNSKFEAEIDAALRSMEGLEDRYRIILQTSIMFYRPLSVENLQEIAELRGDSLEQVQQEEAILMKDLDRRFEKATREKTSAYNLYARARRIEFRLFALERDPQADSKEKQFLTREISKKSSRRDQLLSRYHRPIRPATRQLADFLGMREANVATINTLLHRARRMLISRRGNGRN